MKTADWKSLSTEESSEIHRAGTRHAELSSKVKKRNCVTANSASFSPLMPTRQQGHWCTTRGIHILRGRATMDPAAQQSQSVSNRKIQSAWNTRSLSLLISTNKLKVISVIIVTPCTHSPGSPGQSSALHSDEPSSLREPLFLMSASSSPLLKFSLLILDHEKYWYQWKILMGFYTTNTH